eukprot:5712941-Amphidinium_carterae.1
MDQTGHLATENKGGGTSEVQRRILQVEQNLDELLKDRGETPLALTDPYQPAGQAKKRGRPCKATTALLAHQADRPESASAQERDNEPPQWYQHIVEEMDAQRTSLKKWIQDKLHCVDECQKDMGATILGLEDSMDRVCLSLGLAKSSGQPAMSIDHVDSKQLTLIFEARMLSIEEEVKKIAEHQVDPHVDVQPILQLQDNLKDRVDQLFQGLDRCTKICNMHQTHIGSMASRLQLVSDSSVIAMQQATLMRSQQERVALAMTAPPSMFRNY